MGQLVKLVQSFSECSGGGPWASWWDPL